MGLFIFAILVILAGVVFTLFIPGKSPNVKFGGIGGIVLGSLLLISSMIVVIDAGEVGAVVIFGRVQESTLESGIHLVPPYANIVKYPVRLREYSLSGGNSVQAIVINGLSISIDSTTLYAISPERAGDVYSRVAVSISALEQSILMPTIRSAIRDVCSEYLAEEIYSTKRTEVTDEIEEVIKGYMEPLGVRIERFMIRAIQLPKVVDDAIQRKISIEEDMKAMEYTKQKAEQQREIKIIEARGLAEAQRIINATLTPNYLQHEAIQAYRELAGSDNTTFVILPTNPNASGMPIILNSK